MPVSAPAGPPLSLRACGHMGGGHGAEVCFYSSAYRSTVTATPDGIGGPAAAAARGLLEGGLLRVEGDGRCGGEEACQARGVRPLRMQRAGPLRIDSDGSAQRGRGGGMQLQGLERFSSAKRSPFICASALTKGNAPGECAGAPCQIRARQRALRSTRSTCLFVCVCVCVYIVLQRDPHNRSQTPHPVTASAEQARVTPRSATRSRRDVPAAVTGHTRRPGRPSR